MVPALKMIAQQTAQEAQVEVAVLLLQQMHRPTVAEQSGGAFLGEVSLTAYSQHVLEVGFAAVLRPPAALPGQLGQTGCDAVPVPGELATLIEGLPVRNLLHQPVGAADHQNVGFRCVSNQESRHPGPVPRRTYA